jgi:hypothetical protein
MAGGSHRTAEFSPMAYFPSAADIRETLMSDNIIRALKTFKLDQHHEKIYDNPNELIEAGFPASFLVPLIKVFESSDGYKYFRKGTIVDEMIGISHLSLIYAIVKHLGLPTDVGSNHTGRGFAMQENIDAIRIYLTKHGEPTGG